jgi:hypothetical protein
VFRLFFDSEAFFSLMTPEVMAALGSESQSVRDKAWGELLQKAAVVFQEQFAEEIGLKVSVADVLEVRFCFFFHCIPEITPFGSSFSFDSSFAD